LKNASSAISASATSAMLANGVASSDGAPDEKERSDSPSPLLTLAGPRPGSFEAMKPNQSEDLPPMVKLEPDFNPATAGSTANEDMKSRPAALLSPTLLQDKAVTHGAIYGGNKILTPAWLGKEESRSLRVSVALPRPNFRRLPRRPRLSHLHWTCRSTVPTEPSGMPIAAARQGLVCTRRLSWCRRLIPASFDPTLRWNPPQLWSTRSLIRWPRPPLRRQLIIRLLLLHWDR
jgi:hypothetical protein